MDSSEAVQAHLGLNAKLSIGMHYGTFQLSAEPYSEPLELLKKAIDKEEISPSAFIALDVGQRLVISTFATNTIVPDYYNRLWVFTAILYGL